ncbi:hypothetical protein L6R53_02440 [Myxococcota bacterium]|nr:hypothetical protein [Myxococcota bacterium]
MSATIHGPVLPLRPVRSPAMLFLLGALLGLLLGLPAWLATAAGVAAVARLPQPAHASGVLASR